jgi:hypothetical protein
MSDIGDGPPSIYDKAEQQRRYREQYQQQQYGPPGAYPPGQPIYYRVETHPKAIHAIVAAALAWVACPFVPALFALSFANAAQRGIDESGGRYGGEGLVTAARAVAWINLVVYGIGGLIFVLVLMAGGASQGY